MSLQAPSNAGLRRRPAARATASAPPTQDARGRILRAAARLFGEKGFAGTSVQDLAAAAEIRPSLLYYYFADKQSLFASVMQEALAEFNAMLDSAFVLPGSHAERLEAFVRGHLDLMWRRGELARVVHRCLLDGMLEPSEHAPGFDGPLGRMEAFLAEAMAAGEFRPMDPGLAARSLLGSTFIFSLWRLYEGERYPRETIAAHVTEQLLRGFLR